MTAGKSIDRKAGGMKARKAALLLVTLVALLFAAPAYGADYDTTLIITNPGAGDPFYPFVKDGYRDTISAYLRETAVNIYDEQPYCDLPKVPPLELAVVVLDSADQVVRHLDGKRSSWKPQPHYGGDLENEILLQWDGRDDAGNLVPQNAWYRFQTTATPQCTVFDEWGNEFPGGVGDTEITTSAAFKAATKLVPKTAKQRRWGTDPSALGHSDHCRAFIYTEILYLNATYLRCNGGAYAFARYGFHIPRSAYDIKWGASTGKEAYKPYYWQKFAKRPQANKVVVTFRAGGYIQYYITKVWITYSYMGWI